MLSVRAKVALVLASQAASAVVAYGSLLVTGRFFDPAAYGMVAVAFGLGNLLAVATDFGLGYAHQRQVAMGLERNLALGALVRLRLALVAAVAVACAAALTLAGRPILAVFGDSTTPLVLAAGFAFQLLAIARALPESTWQAEQRVHLVEGLRTAESLLVLFVLTQAGLLLATLNGHQPPFVGVGRFWASALGLQGPLGLEQAALLILGAYLAAKAVTLGLALAWARGEGLRFTAWDAKVARGYVAMALPLSIVSVLAIVLVSTDTVFLGAFWDAREVAYYGAAQRLASLCLLVGAGAAAVLFPRYAQLHAAGDREGQDATFQAAQRYLLLVAAPFAAALVALPQSALAVTVGPAYLAAAGPLALLAGWALVTTLAQPITARLMGEGRTRPLVVATAVAAGCNLLLLVLLVPPSTLGWGAKGAALSTLLATAASYAYLRLWARRHHATPLWHSSLPRILAGAAVVGVGWWAAGTFLPSTWLDHAWELAVAGVLGLGVYVAVLALARELTPDDLDVVARLFNPKGWRLRPGP